MELAITNNNLTTDFNYNYKGIEIPYDESLKTLFIFMQGKHYPLFNTSLIQELKHIYETVKNHPYNDCPIDYLVVSSDASNNKNHEDEITFFRSCIDRQDSESLRNYAYSCIEIGYENTHNFDRDITTISLLQDSTYGVDFEIALSCNIIVAERGITIGFPEIHFNLFPGMGAYTYLSRLVEPNFVENIIASGNSFTSEELYERGIINVLADPGEGKFALNEYIKKHQNHRLGRTAMQKARLRTYPVSLKTLRDIADIWVDAALNLSSTDLKIFDRLARRQRKFDQKMPIRQVT